MTRKDFELIARALKDARPIFLGSAPAPSQTTLQLSQMISRSVWTACVREMAALGRSQKTRFDADRFYEACGCDSEDLLLVNLRLETYIA